MYRQVTLAIGFMSVAGAAPVLQGPLTGTSPLDWVEAAKMAPGLALGILYVIEGLMPPKSEDLVSEVGSMALHLTAAAVALLSIVLDLFSLASHEMGHALHTEEPLIALYTCIIVMSLVRVAGLRRRGRERADKERAEKEAADKERNGKKLQDQERQEGE